MVVKAILQKILLLFYDPAYLFNEENYQEVFGESRKRLRSMATQELLDLALKRATSLSSRYGGMASITLQWHPYNCEWVSRADWSNGNKFEYSHKSAEKSLVGLSCLLWEDKHGQ